MVVFFAGALWFAFATDKYGAPPPAAGIPAAPAPEPIRRPERPDISPPEPSFKHDTLFNNNQF